MIKGKGPDPYKEVEIFPYISSQLPQVSIKYYIMKLKESKNSWGAKAERGGL